MTTCILSFISEQKQNIFFYFRNTNRINSVYQAFSLTFRNQGFEITFQAIGSKQKVEKKGLTIEVRKGWQVLSRRI